MEKINGYRFVNYTNRGLGIQLAENYKFEYSKTGSVKFVGNYKPKYFKKETLNSYDIINIGRYDLMIFTDGFDIDEKKCKTVFLEFSIFLSKSRIENLKNHIDSLNDQLISLGE
jgi:hypothetical protein